MEKSLRKIHNKNAKTLKLIPNIVTYQFSAFASNNGTVIFFNENGPLK